MSRRSPDDPVTVMLERVRCGAPQKAETPAAGERAYVLAVRPDAGGSEVTLGAKKPSKPPAPPKTGTAQDPVDASILTLAPGAGVRLANVTSRYVQFEVPEGVDNATAEITATPTLPADLDLYLQHRGSDGRWSADLAAGTSGELTHEEMTTGRLPAGTYRIEVHNWAGPAGNLPLEVTFFNTLGEPGA